MSSVLLVPKNVAARDDFAGEARPRQRSLDVARAEVEAPRDRRRMATRRVAGGRARSARPPVNVLVRGTDAGGRRGSNTKRREFPPRPLPRSENRAFVVPVVSRFARDHRLPYVTPSGVEKRVVARAPNRSASLPPQLVRLPLLPRFVCEHEVDAAAERGMRVPPPFDEPRRPRIRFRVFREFHEGAGHRFVQMR